MRIFTAGSFIKTGTIRHNTFTDANDNEKQYPWYMGRP